MGVVIKAEEIKAGDVFQSNRAEEGIVKAMCDYGVCKHDERPQSIHVQIVDAEERVYIGAQFFICMIGRDVELQNR